MLKIKKRMRQALALFFSLFFIVAPTFASSQVYAELACGEQTPAGLPTFCSIGYHSEPKVNMVCPFASTCYQGSSPAPAECSWSVTADNKPIFCWSFKEDDPAMPLLLNSKLRFNCVNRGNVNDCGGILAQLGMQTTGNNNQIVDPSSLPGKTPIGDGGNGNHYTCVSMDYNQDAIRQFAMAQGVRQCLQTAGLIVGGVTLAGVSVAALPIGVALVGTGHLVAGAAIGGSLAAGSGVTATQLNQAQTCISTLNGTNAGGLLDWNGSVISRDGTQTYCSTKTTLTLNSSFNVTGNSTSSSEVAGPPFSLCGQIPDKTQRDKCVACSTTADPNDPTSKGGDAEHPTAIWTAVGCIPTTSGGIVQSLVKLGLGIAGAAALLMILAGGFMLSASQGDTKRVGEAKELVTSAVIGLLFIIFSVALLQFIGVKIFNIPGFG